jgi:ABC-type Zn uptake system ZnuABC Zn-binding protein ZnuA
MGFSDLRAAALAALAWVAPLAGSASPAAAPAAAPAPIRVTTTLEVLRALVEAVGGERVRVEAIAAPQFDPHFIEPRPSDIVRLGRSDFFVHMGLDLELWRGPLVEAAVNPRLLPGGAGEIDCSIGIPLLEVPQRALSRVEGDIHLFGNPHYWLDPANAARMAERIAGRLGEFAPDAAPGFRERAERFGQDLERRRQGWEALLSPYRGARLAAYHNSWPYFAQAFALRVDLFLEPKPGIPPSGIHLETLAETMKREKVRVILMERYQPRRTAESVAKRTGARLVEVWQNPDPKMGYVEMMDRNVRALAEALAAPGGPS